VSKEAARQKVDPAALCSGVIAEHFLGDQIAVPSARAGHSYQEARLIERPEPTRTFDVAKLFPNYPARSVDLAQRFVDEALRISKARAFKAYSGRGIGIEPNFVFVEYLQKSHLGGIGVSFYGRPEDHIHTALLRPGRNPNYSRAIACTQEALSPLLEEIGRSHELKFGRVPGR